MTDSLKTQNKKIYGPYDHHITCNIHTPEGEDMCKQSFGQECDINHIMAKYKTTGIIESGNSQNPSYGDASAFDFQEAQNLIIIAQNMFNNLPAQTRSFFQNEAKNLMSWIDNPDNTQEAIRMGLLAAPEVVSGVSMPLGTEGATTPLKPLQ